jgi:hypothetical protein
MAVVVAVGAIVVGLVALVILLLHLRLKVIMVALLEQGLPQQTFLLEVEVALTLLEAQEHCHPLLVVMEEMEPHLA